MDEERGHDGRYLLRGAGSARAEDGGQRRCSWARVTCSRRGVGGAKCGDRVVGVVAGAENTTLTRRKSALRQLIAERVAGASAGQLGRPQHAVLHQACQQAVQRVAADARRGCQLGARGSGCSPTARSTASRFAPRGARLRLCLPTARRRRVTIEGLQAIHRGAAAALLALLQAPSARVSGRQRIRPPRRAGGGRGTNRTRRLRSVARRRTSARAGGQHPASTSPRSRIASERYSTAEHRRPRATTPARLRYTDARPRSSLDTIRHHVPARPSPLLLILLTILLLLDHFRLPPPRPRPTRIMPGLPCLIYLACQEGGSSAKRWTPLPRKPRRDAAFRPGAGRRLVALMGKRLERNT